MKMKIQNTSFIFPRVLGEYAISKTMTKALGNQMLSWKGEFEDFVKNEL